MKKNGVILAIDVNDFDQDVLDLAAEMAKQFEVDLDLLHVTLIPDPGSSISPAGLNSQTGLSGDHRRLLNMKTNIEGVELNYHHLSGFPAHHIAEFANRNEPRLLVLGTHARVGLSRLLGSVALKVMRKVSCPVMTLRQKRADGQSQAIAHTKR